MSKYVVPEGGLKAAVDARMLVWEKANDGYRSSSMGVPAEATITAQVMVALEAFVRWQAENPVVPTDAFLREMLNRDFFSGENWTDPQVFAFCVEWQRRMYLALEVPEEIKDLLYNEHDIFPPIERHNNAVLAAYWRGKEAK